MLKHIIVLLVVSIIIILAMPYAHQAVHALLFSHDWIAQTLRTIFTGGEAGNVVRELIAILLVPIIVGLVPALIYWLAKRRWFPYFMEVVWVVWLIQTAALVALYKI